MGTLGPPILDWTTHAPARRFLSGITQATVFGLRQYFARGGLLRGAAPSLDSAQPSLGIASLQKAIVQILN